MFKKKDKKKVKLILVVDFISPNLSIGKDSDTGRDWGQEEKGTDSMDVSLGELRELVMDR